MDPLLIEQLLKAFARLIEVPVGIYVLIALKPQLLSPKAERWTFLAFLAVALGTLMIEVYAMARGVRLLAPDAQNSFISGIHVDLLLAADALFLVLMLTLLLFRDRMLAQRWILDRVMIALILFHFIDMSAAPFMVSKHDVRTQTLNLRQFTSMFSV